MATLLVFEAYDSLKVVIDRKRLRGLIETLLVERMQKLRVRDLF